MPFRLAPRQRATFRAFGEALFAQLAPQPQPQPQPRPQAQAQAQPQTLAGPRPAQLDALVDGIEQHLQPVSRTQRVMLLLGLELVRWLPVLLLTALSPFEELPLAKRVRLLERMDRSRVTLMLVPFIAFKTLLSMHFFEDEGELRAMGYPGDDQRKRWLRTAA